jgi:type IV pilus assembly protein PilQ
MKEASTEMMVKDGDTVVIGGIIFKKETLQDNKVPGLGDIPLLGWLFKTRYRTTADTELLIFLTPKIVKPSLSERFRNDS